MKRISDEALVSILILILILEFLQHIAL